MPSASAHYVRTPDSEGVCLHLRGRRLPAVLVVPPATVEDSWVGTFPHDTKAQADLGKDLSTAFGEAVTVTRHDNGWSFVLFSGGAEKLRLEPATALDGKNAARDFAKQIVDLLRRPKEHTRLARLLAKRDTPPGEALAKFGESLHLPYCGETFLSLSCRLADHEHVIVEGSRIQGKLGGWTAGPGYENLAELIEDTVAPFLERENFSAALRALRAYDVMLSRQNDALACAAPKGIVTPRLLELFKQHKDGLLAALA